MTISIELICLFAVLAIASISAIAIYLVHSKERKIRETDVVEADDIITTTIKKRTKKIRLAGVNLSVRQYYLIMALSTTVLFLFAMYASSNFVFSLITAILGCMIPNIFINILRTRESKLFSENFQKALDIMSSSLKAGNTIKIAVKDVIANQFVPTNVKEHFKKIDAELEMGVTVADAFRHFAEETGNYYVEQTSIAIDVQTTIGNREDVVIKSISSNILDELTLNKEVNAAFATTTSMVRLMDFMPTLVYIFFTVTSRSYVDIYFSSPLMMSVFLLLFSLPLIGSFITHRMLRNVRKKV